MLNLIFLIFTLCSCSGVNQKNNRDGISREEERIVKEFCTQRAIDPNPVLNYLESEKDLSDIRSSLKKESTNSSFFKTLQRAATTDRRGLYGEAMAYFNPELQGDRYYPLTTDIISEDYIPYTCEKSTNGILGTKPYSYLNDEQAGIAMGMTNSGFGVLKQYAYVYNPDNWDLWSCEKKANYLVAHKHEDGFIPKSKERPINYGTVRAIFNQHSVSPFSIKHLGDKNGLPYEEKYLLQEETLVYRGMRVSEEQVNLFFKTGISCPFLCNGIANDLPVTDLTDHKYNGYPRSVFLSCSREPGVAYLFATSTDANVVNNATNRYNTNGYMIVVKCPASQALDLAKLREDQAKNSGGYKDREQEILMTFKIPAEDILGAYYCEGNEHKSRTQPGITKVIINPMYKGNANIEKKLYRFSINIPKVL